MSNYLNTITIMSGARTGRIHGQASRRLDLGAVGEPLRPYLDGYRVKAAQIPFNPEVYVIQTDKPRDDRGFFPRVRAPWAAVGAPDMPEIGEPGVFYEGCRARDNGPAPRPLVFSDWLRDQAHRETPTGDLARYFIDGCDRGVLRDGYRRADHLAQAIRNRANEFDTGLLNDLDRLIARAASEWMTDVTEEA